MKLDEPIRLPFVGLLAIALIALSTSMLAARSGLVGAIDGVDASGIASGWAQDLDTPAVSIAVHFYVDGLAGAGGVFAGAVTADMLRAEPGSGQHGFRFVVPSRFRDSVAHTLYVYGIDSSGIDSENGVLSTEPRAFTLQPTVVRLDNGTIRFGVEPRCGGTLVEMSLNGYNFVNNADCTGRQVQVALYDGKGAYDSCAGCQGIWGWDPVQGGDMFNFGSPLLAQVVTTDQVYIATQPYEWYPSNKGGGPGRPVLSDVTIEQTASFVPGYPNAVRLHYRISHFGLDSHAQAIQEFPAVYVNRGYDNFVSYAGTAPWTGGAVTSALLPAPGQPNSQRYVSERWGALVNSQGVGLTVYVPQQYPYIVGITFDGTTGEYGFGANYFRPHVPFSFGPGSVLEADVYVIAGDYRAARQVIEGLHAVDTAPDVLPPFGWLDAPALSQPLTGTVSVSGWVFDNVQIASVDVIVDGNPAGVAIYGAGRADVASTYPHAPSQIGFTYALDTRRYASGSHQLRVQATDGAGNVSIIAESSMVVTNSAAGDVTAPTVSIVGVTSSGSNRSLAVAVQASDAVGVVRVRMYIDNQLAATDTTKPYSFSLNVSNVSRGVHQLVARATDAAGNVGTSSAVQWTKK